MVHHAFFENYLLDTKIVQHLKVIKIIFIKGSITITGSSMNMLISKFKRTP